MVGQEAQDRTDKFSLKNKLAHRVGVECHSPTLALLLLGSFICAGSYLLHLQGMSPGMCFCYDAFYTSFTNMKIHILGIGGTFMAGIAIIAKQLGHEVTGSDKNLYDPMKSVLKNEKINFTEGYNPRFLKQSIDLIIVFFEKKVT